MKKRPEHLAVALAAVAWLWMLVRAVQSQRLSCCAACTSGLEELAGWTAMVVAMMFPNTLDALREVSARSYRQRRLRAVCCYLFGYVAWWTILGLLVLGARQFRFTHDPRIAIVLCTFAAGWVLLPARERWHRLCHRSIALFPVGWRADRDTLRQGAIHAWPCAAACWPLMVACAVTGHHLLLMLGGTILGSFEKRMFRFRRQPLIVGALLLAVTSLGVSA
jgi:hypothetical protein